MKKCNHLFKDKKVVTGFNGLCKCLKCGLEAYLDETSDAYDERQNEVKLYEQKTAD